MIVRVKDTDLYNIFKTPLLIAITCLIALGGGAWSALYTLDHFRGFDKMTIGQWHGYPAYGAVDPYARAHRTRQEILSPGSSEGLQFILTTDNQGNRLVVGCDYRLTGNKLPGRFWTLHAAPLSQPTFSDVSSIRSDLPTSLYSGSIWYKQEGKFIINISSQALPDNWLAVPDKHSYQLILSLYDTTLGNSVGFEAIKMPVVEPVTNNITQNPTCSGALL